MRKARPRIITPLGHPIATNTVTFPPIGATRRVAAGPMSPTFLTQPSIVSDGTPAFGETLTGVDGTVDVGTITARAWLRNGSPISGATGATYTLAEADIGANIAFRNTATAAGGDATATSAAVGPIAGFTLPALTSAKFNGDSRTAGSGDYINNAGSVSVSVGMYGVASAGLIQSLAGNPFLLRQGFQHGVGASTSRAHEERDKSTSIATTGNPALADTGIAADANFSFRSDGAATALTQAGAHVFSVSVGVNDNGGSAGAFYNAPSTAWQTLRTIARIADAYGAAGKVWYLGNEFPRGDSYYTMEQRTVSGGTCTAANTTNFLDGESFGTTGVIGLFASGLPRPLTKVASAPAQDEYTVTSGGLYTFGGTAPTTVWLSYNASPAGGRNATYDQLRIIKEFCESSAPNFVSTVNGVNYGIPGLRFGRPWVRVVDTFGALVNPASGAAQLPKPGTYDSLQLHNLGYGQYLAGKAFAAAIAADYPTRPDRSGKPTRNNWFAARGLGTGTAFSGTLPPTMRSAFTGGPVPTLVARNGVVIGSVDPGTGAITGTAGSGIVSGTLNFATGVWSITFAANSDMPANAQLWFEQDIGNYDVAAFTEGSIGRNAAMNGLLDPFTAVGTNLTVVNGSSSITGIASTAIPYGYTLINPALDAAIVAGTAVAAVTNGTDADGFPMFLFDLQGRHSAAMLPSLSTSNIANFGGRVTPGDQVLFGANVRHARHPSIGKHYGNNGYTGQIMINLSTPLARPSPTGPRNVTSLSSRVHDAGTGLYQVDEQIMRDEGGTWDQYRVAALLDTTGAAFNTAQGTIFLTRSVANVPIAVRIGVGRVQARRRNDVA